MKPNKLTPEEITKAVEIMNRVREEAMKDSRYGFDDDFDTFIRKMMCLNPQSYGARIQKFLIERFGLKNIAAAQDSGDFLDQFERLYELKVSLITPSNNCLNLVQLRQWQEIDGYYCVAIDTTKTPFVETVFVLSKKQMNEEIIKMGASSAHGTKKAIESNKNVELRLSLNMSTSDSNYKRWIENYKQKISLNKSKLKDGSDAVSTK